MAFSSLLTCPKQIDLCTSSHTKRQHPHLPTTAFLASTKQILDLVEKGCGQPKMTKTRGLQSDLLQPSINPTFSFFLFLAARHPILRCPSCIWENSNSTFDRIHPKWCFVWGMAPQPPCISGLLLGWTCSSFLFLF